MRYVAWPARRLLAALVILAAFGWVDRIGGLPGPRVGLALPLREPSHHAAVPLFGLLAVWTAAWAIAALVARPRHVLLAAAVRGAVAFAVVLATQAASIEVVRQAVAGFAWRAALATSSPYVAAGCASAATLLAASQRARTLGATALERARAAGAPLRRLRAIRRVRARELS
jgi:hypothetical protein